MKEIFTTLVFIIKAPIHISSILLITCGLMSCSKYSYKKEKLQVTNQEDYYSEQETALTNGASSIEAFRNEDKALCNEFQNRTNSITQKVKQLHNRKCMIEAFVNKSQSNQSVNLKTGNHFVTEKQTIKKKKTELYDNLSFLSTTLGIFSFLFSMVVSNIGIFLGGFTLIIGIIGMIGIYTNVSSKFKKSIRFAILGIFLGLLAIILGITMLTI